MDLADRARRAYELGRVRRALKVALFVPVLTALAVACCGPKAGALVCGGLLSVAVVALLWRGEAAGRAVLPGVLAGLAPFSLAVCGALGGHPCVEGPWCTFLVGACFVGGLVGGLFVAASSSRGNWRELGVGAGLAALTGALGCVVAGTVGVVGLGAGVLFGALPVFALRSRP